MATSRHPPIARKAAAPAPKSTPRAKPAAKRLAPAGRKASAQTQSKPSPTKTDAPKPTKPKKPKLVRDSFTIPKNEYTAIDTLKRRAATMGRSPKKSELLRAGLMLLINSSDSAFDQALAQVPAIKTGRPKA